MKTHINNISLFFLSLFFALSVQATTTPVKEKKQVVKEAVAQLNYLYKKNGIPATKKSNKWYVYFVGGNLNDLKYVINKSDKQFAETYLKRLNDSLVNVNTQVNSKAAVYVAFTDYKQIFNTPIFPKEYNTEALKLLHIDNLIQNNKETNSYNIDSLKNAKTGYKSYREELRNLIIEVYENSDLSKSDKENIIMPFTNYTIRNILKPDKNYDKKTVFAYTMYTPKLKEDIVKGHFNKIYKTNKQKLDEQGLTSSEKNMLSAVASLNIWFNGVRPPYKECEELLVEYKDSPLMQHAALKNTIIENPCILKNMVPWGDSIPKSQWMEELEMLIAAPLYAALCIPAASIAGGAGVFEYLQAQAATFTAKKAKDIAIAAAMNITMQTLINYYWDEEVAAITNENERWKKAVEKISKISLGKDVLAAALEFSLRADLVADCLEGAIADNELNWSKLDFDPAKFEIKPEKCATNVAINLFAKPVLKGASTILKRLKVLVTNKPNLFIKGWRRMKREMPAELGDEFLKYIEDIADAVDFKKDAQNFADKYVYAAVDVEQALSEAVEEYATEVVSTAAAQQFANTIKNAATESTLLIRGAVPKVLADNTTKLVKKIGANIKLQFSVDNVPTNIQATLLEELEDKTYRLVFVNSSTDNTLENFLKKTSSNRKKVIDALKNEKATFTATATGTNATAIDINGKNIDIVEVELRTPKANTDDFDSEVIVNKNTKSLINNIDDFAKLSRAQKLTYIQNAWQAYYPQIFFERRLFEDMMGEYRYLKTSGWGHTGEIASNFKAIDFYKNGTTSGKNIFTETAVSMKTTTTTNVTKWLASSPVKKNLDNLDVGLDQGITWNGKTVVYTKAEVHIYMPKEKFTNAIKAQWLSVLKQQRPTIEFKINTLEEFIP